MKWSEVVRYYEAKINELNAKKDPKAKYITSSYRRFINNIKESYPNESLDTTIVAEDVDGLDVSDHMKDRIKSMMRNVREVRDAIAADASATPANAHEILRTQITGLLGIGGVKADELINAGLKTIAQLKTKKFKSMLPEVTQKILEYEPDRKIPHECIAKVESLVLSLCDSADGCINSIILGSYRRKNAASRDIDLMVVSDDIKILDKFLARAKSTFGETNVIPYATGEDKLSVLVRFNNLESLKDEKLGVYKLDVFRAPQDRAHAMQLYATGSKDFNIIMRRNAKNKGFLLNQDGLYDRETNKLIPTNSERDIFEKLGMT